MESEEYVSTRKGIEHGRCKIHYGKNMERPVVGARGTAASLPPLSRSLRVRAHPSNIRPPSSLVDVLASVHDNTLQTAAQALLR